MSGSSGKIFDQVEVKRKEFDRLLAVAHKLDRAHVKVGILASKGGEQTHADSGMTLIEIAALHEFGNEDTGGYIPERSFIRRTFLERVRDGLATKQAELAKLVVTKGMDPLRALAILGSWGAAEVKNTITTADIPPPLAQSTIDARERMFGKASTKPLLATGQLKNSISYEVIEE